MRKRVVVIAATMVAVSVALWTAVRWEDDRPSPVAGPPVVTTPPVPTASPSRTQQPPPSATSVVPRPHAPINRYLSGDELWNAYQAFRRSLDGGELWVAETTLRGCFFTTRSNGIVAEILAGRGVMSIEPMTPEEEALFLSGRFVPRTRVEKPTDDQVAAAREIAARCAPFATMTSTEYRAQVNDTIGRRQHADDPVAVAESIRAGRLQATDERLRFVLDSQDPVAIDFLQEVLASRLAQRAGREPTDDEAAAAYQGLQLVQCDLGNDCDANSERALVECMHVADRCRLDVPAQTMARETPLVRQMIAAQRQRMLAAIIARDYAIWSM